MERDKQKLQRDFNEAITHNSDLAHDLEQAQRTLAEIPQSLEVNPSFHRDVHDVSQMMVDKEPGEVSKLVYGLSYIYDGCSS